MVLVAITGSIGAGKTLAMTWRGFEFWKNGCTIYANYNVKYPHVYVETLEDLENMHGTPDKPAVALFDEFWRWLDSRQYKKHKNDILTKMMMYSRKRGIDIYWSSQRFHMMEKRIRDITDTCIEPVLSDWHKVMFQGRKQMMPRVCTCKWYGIAPFGSGYRMTPKPLRILKFWTLPIMAMYDTRQEVQAL